MKTLTKTTIAAAMALVIAGPAAHASHFRGASLIPSVNANGLLSVTSTTFWRKRAANNITPSITGVGSMTLNSSITDTSDSRFDRRVNIYTKQLAGAGSYDISARSCCRVRGIQNSVGNSSVAWKMNSRIVWDGASTNTPISFDFATVQPNVQRGNTYTQSLNAIGGPGITLTYDNALNLNGGGSFTQTPGFTIDPATGVMTIPAVDTTTMTDNPSNPGADYMFSGNITASDGSFVEYDWLWDAVNATGPQNKAPVVNNIVINALVGDNISHIMTATDPENDPLTWDMISFLGGGMNTPTFNALTQQFMWNSTGSAAGSYIANIRANDGSLTDVGTITINLASNTNTSVPEPGILALLSLGLLGLVTASRRRKDEPH